MDNTVHFQNYNTGFISAHGWQETSFFIRLREDQRQRSIQIVKEGKQRQERHELQRVVLQLLINAELQPVHVNEIAERIDHSRQFTIFFLAEDTDDLWISVEGDKAWWMTSLQLLPDRLFY